MKQVGDGGNIWSLRRDKRYISTIYRSMKRNQYPREKRAKNINS